MDLIDHTKIKQRLEESLDGIPKQKSILIREIIGDLYQDFAVVLRIEQANGVNTGLAQSIHGNSAIIKVDLELPDRYKEIGRRYKESK